MEQPEWAHRAEKIDHKPDWADGIPEELTVLGEVFFPIPAGKKGWNYAHHLDESRYSWDSEILNAYLEAGWNYGIACDGDLVVIDIDDLEYQGDMINGLPPTIYQRSGSGSGLHIFYKCQGVNKRRNLHVYTCPSCGKEFHEFDVEGDDDEKSWYCPNCGEEYSDEFERRHVGELRANVNEYVVGPGSTHPSGGEYGPLKGEGIVEITPDKLADALRSFIKTPDSSTSRTAEERVGYGAESGHRFYKLTAEDVMPGLEPGKRISHPIHGSTTGSNFMKNKGGDTFVCWRCEFGTSQGCVLNGAHYLALEAIGSQFGDHACEVVRRKWRRESKIHYYAWEEAVRKGLIGYSRIPYTVVKGFMVDDGEISEDEHLKNRTEGEKILRYYMDCQLNPDLVEQNTA